MPSFYPLRWTFRRGLSFSRRYASAERTLDVIKLMLERKVLMKESVLKTIHNKFIGSKYADRVFELFEGHCLAGNHDEDNRLVENLFLFYVSAKLLDRSRSLFDRLTAAGETMLLPLQEKGLMRSAERINALSKRRSVAYI